MQRIPTPFRTLLLSLGALVVTLAPAWANDPSAPVANATPMASLVAAPSTAFLPFTPLWAQCSVGQSGMLAFLDPETHTFRAPAQGEGVEGLPAVDNWQETLVEEPTWDGSMMLVLHGHMQDFSIAQIGPDGRVVMSCVQDPNQALNSNVAPAAKPVEE